MLNENLYRYTLPQIKTLYNVLVLLMKEMKTALKHTEQKLLWPLTRNTSI